jgi:hypothetical protein
MKIATGREPHHEEASKEGQSGNLEHGRRADEYEREGNEHERKANEHERKAERS